MKKDFSKSWKKSVQPRKQRKFRFNSPLHRKRNFMSSHLSKELREKLNKRSIPVRKEDKVKILRGQFKKITGKIVKVDYKRIKVNVDSAQLVKKDGSKVFYPINPSNIMIIELNIDDKERKKIFDKLKNVTSKKAESS